MPTRIFGKDGDWSDADREHLARLVRKYGRAAVIARAEGIVRSKPRGNRRNAALAEDVEWIEARKEDLKKQVTGGSKKKVSLKKVGLKQATRERFEKRYPSKRSDDHAFQNYRKSIKNQRDKWSAIDKIVKAGREAAYAQGRAWQPTKSPRK